MCSGTRLFVGNLPIGVKNLEKGLQDEFSHYGEVKDVELKIKKDVDGKEVGKFAFVTLQTDTRRVNQCINEFSEQEWHGVHLSVSVAKESFLERLKREREENEKKKNKQDVNSELASNGHIEKINIKMPHKRTAEDYESRKEIYTHKTPKEKTLYRSTEDTYNCTEEVSEETVDKKEPKRPKRPKNRVKNIPIDESVQLVNEITKQVKKLTPSDEKRLKSMQMMRSAYNEKKSLIKMALSSVDKKVNKIVFDEDGEQIKMSDQLNGDHSINEDNKPTGKRKAVQNDIEIKNKKAKPALFDDEDDQEELEYNFEVKEHFQGEAGQKLLQLQSRYKSDKRFILDERFMENNNDQTHLDDNVEEDCDEQGDDDGVEMDVDRVHIDEKKKEIEILESILGTSVKTSNRIKDNLDGKKQVPIKTMLRYDPARPDHDKFTSKPPEKGETTVTKKSKKEKREIAETKSEEEKLKNAPVVSQDRYYKVNQSLKQAMLGEDKKPFSLLSMFGKSTETSENKNVENTDESYKAEPIEKINKTKNSLPDTNPFRYDSDTDEEREEKAQKSNKNSSEENVQPAVSILVKENFFFLPEDSRLSEGVKFFLDAKPTTERSRVELKNLVKKRIRNNVRNERSHHHNIQQNGSSNVRKGNIGRKIANQGGRGKFKR